MKPQYIAALVAAGLGVAVIGGNMLAERDQVLAHNGGGGGNPVAVPGDTAAGAPFVTDNKKFVSTDGRILAAKDAVANHTVGNAIVGEGIVGDKIVGEKIVGDKIVGDKIVGDKLVGEGHVGPKRVGPKRVGPAIVGAKIVGPRHYGGGGGSHKRTTTTHSVKSHRVYPPGWTHTYTDGPGQPVPQRDRRY